MNEPTTAQILASQADARRCRLPVKARTFSAHAGLLITEHPWGEFVAFDAEGQEIEDTKI